VRAAAERHTPAHRAVDDAEGERQRWLAVRRRAEEEAAKLRAGS
jgi:hypothetical protein